MLYYQEMAHLTREDVLKLAQLCRIYLTETEIDSFADEFSAILDYVEQLQTVDIENLNPTSQVTGLTNVSRADEVRSYGYEPQKLLENVPHLEQNQIKVKRMLE